MDEIERITMSIDAWLNVHDRDYMTLDEASYLLEMNGTLEIGRSVINERLVQLLEEGKLAQAYKKSDGKWRIPRSYIRTEYEREFENRVRRLRAEVEARMSEDEKSLGNLWKHSKFRRVEWLRKTDIPETTGIYAIMIDDEDALPQPFADELKKRKHKLLYIGKSEGSLRQRVWNEELHCKRAATFFRSIGAMLGYRPKRGYLDSKSRNYKFSKRDEERIIKWMKEHLLFNCVEIKNDIKGLEELLIKENMPLINLQHNPGRMKEIVELRRECREIGWGNKSKKKKEK